MQILILSIFLLFFSTLFSQEKVSVSFILIDDATKVELENCSLKISGNTIDKKIINYYSKDTIVLSPISFDEKITIEASLSRYSTIKKTIDLTDYKREIKKQNLIEITLAFKYDGQNIIEVEVNLIA